jgi:hypothetical protein
MRIPVAKILKLGSCRNQCMICKVGECLERCSIYMVSTSADVSAISMEMWIKSRGTDVSAVERVRGNTQLFLPLPICKTVCCILPLLLPNQQCKFDFFFVLTQWNTDFISNSITLYFVM